MLFPELLLTVEWCAFGDVLVRDIQRNRKIGAGAGVGGWGGETYYKELPHAILEAWKSQDLQLSVLLTIVTMMYITFSKLTCLITGNLYF